ncbi:MAG: hypothetical protein NZM25_06980 [Leptospiraceae bacterium]|nr:hypothetical protein [Leptospiraceae bacterium]MDW8307063.1 hypothetical protein [Leptospiraceae bacterium]
MLSNLKKISLAHLIGLLFLALGWLLSVNFAAIMARLKPMENISTVMYHPISLIGLLLILLGAYFPELYLKIKPPKGN